MFKKAGSIAALALLLWLPCDSQFTPRTVTGVVTDKRDNPLPGAVVQVENTVSLTIRSYVTGKNGRYYFNELRDDTDLTLRAKYRNYWSEPKTLSRFNSSTHLEVNLMIPIE